MQNKLILAAILASAAAFSPNLWAQSAAGTASAQQTSQSQSVAQGSITFATNPQDQHTTETVRNVSAPVLGSYAFAASQLSCGSTTQGGFAVAGFSGVFGSSKDSTSCVLEVAAAETARQSTVMKDEKIAAKLQLAAIAIRCQISPEVYKAYVAAGLDCLGQHPLGTEDNSNTVQNSDGTQSYRKAQTN
jgi:hypothetical protein